MPVHDIGTVNRKGTLGSPYAVRDYHSVDPALGTMDDLRAFVAAAHQLGMYVILDWVANHTAWDNVLVTEHPEWYDRDQQGRFRPTPWWDWDDIIDLDYSHAGLRRWMTGAMIFWVREADVDGYRCDVAGFVPTRPRRSRRAVGRRRGDAAGLQRPGGRQRQAARVLREGPDPVAGAPSG